MKLSTFFLLLIVFTSVSYNNTFAKINKNHQASKKEKSLQFLEEFNDWSIYTQIESGQKVCFLVSSPINKEGTYKNRNEQFLWVRYVDANIDEVSVTPGYHFKDGTHPEIALYKKQKINNYKQNIILDKKINNCSFRNEDSSYMFDIKDKEQAWVRDIETDKKIIKDMIDSSYSIVSAHSTRNTCSLDVYSLSGFTKAYRKMKKLCAQIKKNS